MGNILFIKCICGKEVKLEIYGGQYQDTYTGICECGRKWVLEEISEMLIEAGIHD